MTAKPIKGVLVGLASGPVLAALLLLIPLGVLTGLNVALDPSLAIDEFAPEEELVLPFILLAGLISAANARLAWVMSREADAGRLFRVTTERYLADPSSSVHAHGHRGRELALDFSRSLTDYEDDSLVVTEPVEEDFGWKFSVRRKGYAELWILVAHVGSPRDERPGDDYVLTVALEPPLLPWRRLVYRPDFALRDETERRLMAFLRVNDMSFFVDFEKWVDPEPGMNPGPMF